MFLCSPPLDISKTDIHGWQRMNLTNFDDLPTFPVGVLMAYTQGLWFSTERPTKIIESSTALPC